MENIMRQRPYSAEDIRAMVFLIAVAILLPILCLATLAEQETSRPVPTPTLTIQKSAWTACVLAVEKRLRIAPTGAQEYTPGNVTHLGDNRYQVIVYYADTGNAYQCELARRLKGDWFLKSLYEWGGGKGKLSPGKSGHAPAHIW